MDALTLWQFIIAHEGTIFTTSGRGLRPGVVFTYSISRGGGAGGRHYKGPSIPGYGNELFIIRAGDGVEGGDGAPVEKRKKSISRSTIDLALDTVIEAQKMGKVISGPKALNIPGAGSYVYGIFREIGVINSTAEVVGVEENGSNVEK